MNIQVQVCGLIVLALLYIFYKSNRTLQIYSEKVFCRTLYISIISLSLDILSLIVIGFMEQLPKLLVVTVCKLYVMSLILEAVSALSYVMTDLYSEKNHIRITRILWLTALIQSFVIAFLPISVFKSEDAAYTYGPAVIFVYIFAILHIIGTVVVIFVCWNKINKRRCFAVGLWMSIWIISAAVQYLDNSLLIVGFASVIGMLILFVIMENPESNLDRRTGCFNSYALSEFSHQLFERKNRTRPAGDMSERFRYSEKR